MILGGVPRHRPDSRAEQSGNLMAYLTIAGHANAEIVVSRSRFLCTLERVEDEFGARSVIEQERREHWNARHHCSAFVIGPTRSLERSQDDGEPPGTGGAPILEVLRGRELSDVVAVVTRWFGGTLLGTGGLSRAYADAARAALDVATLSLAVPTIAVPIAEEIVAELTEGTAQLVHRGRRWVDAPLSGP